LSVAPSSPILQQLTAFRGRFPGALLLQGSSESALEEASLNLAAFLLCPGEDPDRSCESCRRALHVFHPDLLNVQPEGVQIRVDRVREAIAFGAGKPYESAKRVVRISRAELLGLEAANALLKSLEEPGAQLHWILTTTRPESLLATIRSRCLAVPVSSGTRSDRAREWQAHGFTAEDASDLAALAVEAGEEEARERLEEARRFRSDAVEALTAGILEGKIASLVLLAERLGRAESSELTLFIELLADAALAHAGVSAELFSHRAVAGPLLQIGRRLGSAPLTKAVRTASDHPPDSRRGNRRLHFEKVLLELWLAATAMRSSAPTTAK
jgi:hypothetical protein